MTQTKITPELRKRQRQQVAAVFLKWAMDAEMADNWQEASGYIDAANWAETLPDETFDVWYAKFDLENV